MDSKEENIEVKQTIEIYNPKERPFGELSNNYLYPIIVGKDVYNTVTNFLYSSYMIYPIDKIMLQNADIHGIKKNTVVEDKVNQIISKIERERGYSLSEKERRKISTNVNTDVFFQRMSIYEMFQNILKNEYATVLKLSLIKAYTVILESDENLKEVLLSTGNSPIYYVSKNSIIGTGASGASGLNILGNILVYLRHVMKQKLQSSEKEGEIKKNEDTIFSIYKAYIILQFVLTNMGDIEDYRNKNAEEVYVLFFDKLVKEEMKKGKEEKSHTCVHSKKFNECEICMREALAQKYFNFNNTLRKAVLDMHARGDFPLINRELEGMKKGKTVILDELLEKAQVSNIQRGQTERDKKIIDLFVRFILEKTHPNLTEDLLQKAISEFPESFKGQEGQGKESYDSEEEKYRDKDKKDEKGDKEREIRHSKNLDYTKFVSSLIDSYNKNSLPSDVVTYIKDGLGWEELSDENKIEEKPKKKLKTKGKSDLINILKESSSNEEDSDSKTREFLLTNIVKVSGKPKKKYLKRSTEQLEETFKKYFNMSSTQYQRENFFGVKDYVVYKEPAKDEFIPKNEEKTPVYLYADIDKNSKNFLPFIPKFDKSLIVENLPYPNISIYVTSKLLEMTGIKRIENGLFKRGRTKEEARLLLMEGNYQKFIENLHEKHTLSEKKFLFSNKANDIYATEVKRTEEELMKLNLEIALNKKFQNKDLYTLLKLTGNRTLVWKDPNDTILGTPLNEVGKYLEYIRDVEGWLKEEPELILEKEQDIIGLIFRDTYLKNWMERRVKEMCGTVSKFHAYLSDLDQKEDIDPRFIRLSLSSVYPDCEISIKNIPRMPEEFVRIVETHQNYPVILTKNYVSEIDKIRKRIFELERPESIPVSSAFEKKQSEKFRIYVNGIIPHLQLSSDAEKELILNRKNWKDTVENIRKKYDSTLLQEEMKELEEKYADLDKTIVYDIETKEKEIINEIVKSKLGERFEKFGGKQFREKTEKELEKEKKEDIEKKAKKLMEAERKAERTEQQKEEEEIKIRESIDKDEVREMLKKYVENKYSRAIDKDTFKRYKKYIKYKFEINLKLEKQRKEQEEALQKNKNQYAEKKKKILDKNTIRDFSTKQIRKMITEFLHKQSLETKEIFSRNTVPIENRESDIKSFKQEIQKLTKKMKEEYKHYEKNLRKIALEYWSRISSMVLSLFMYLKETNETDFRKVITNLELLNTEKVNCFTVEVNLPDEEDNCIASAISNILIGIDKFKKHFVENVPLKNEDIELATSILLNTSYNGEEKIHKKEDKLNAEIDLEDTNKIFDWLQNVKKDVKPLLSKKELIRKILEKEPKSKVNEDWSFENLQQRLDALKEEKSISKGEKPETESSSESDVDDNIVEKIEYVLDDNDDEPEDDLENILSDIEESDSGSFGFGSKKRDADWSSSLKRILGNIYGKNVVNLDKNASFFNKKIIDVRKSSLPIRMKLNRINFFATLH